jgi:hypothetical protein
MKKLLKFVAATAVSVTAMHASAGLTFMDAVTGPGDYVVPTFTTLTPTLAYTASDSIVDVRLAPLGTTDYLVVTTGGSATVDLGGVSSYSFLWGSPDTFNTVSILTSTGTETFTGTDFATKFGLTADGENANTRWVTVTASGETLDSITFESAGIAFEVAVTSPVPEPQSYALLLAGLMIVVYVGGRTSGRRDPD